VNDLIDRIAAAAPQPRQPLDLDSVARRGRWLRRRRSGAIAVGSLGLIAVLVVAVGQVHRPRVELEVTQAPALSVLQRAAVPDDRLPDSYLRDLGGPEDSVPASGVRLAQEDRNFRYYVARTTAGSVCLIAAQKSEPAFRASTCPDAAAAILRTAGVIPLSFQSANLRGLVGICRTATTKCVLAPIGYRSPATCSPPTPCRVRRQYRTLLSSAVRQASARSTCREALLYPSDRWRAASHEVSGESCP